MSLLSLVIPVYNEADNVVPDLVQKVLKGQDPLHILGDGGQVRH